MPTLPKLARHDWTAEQLATKAAAAHKASHATGGTDTLAPADIGAATSAQGALAASASQPGHTHTLDSTTDTATRVAMTPAERTDLASLSSTYAPRPWSAPHAGQSLAAMLDMGIGNPVVTVLGDSTGNDWFEWPRQWAEDIAPDYPALTVLFKQWDDATKTYSTTTTLQAGIANTTIVADSFNRVAAEVIGTTGEAGGAWAGTTARFSLDGSKLVVNAAGFAAAYGTGASRAMTTITNLTMNFTGAATARTVEIGCKAVDASNHLFLSLNVPTGSGLTWSVWQRVADVPTKLADGTAYAGTGATSIAASIAVDGTDVAASVTVGGVTRTVTTTITAAVQAALATGGGYTIWAKNADVVGTTVDSIQGTIPGRVLTVYNGSRAGSTLAYQTTNFAAMVPVAPTVAILNSCHNYGATTPADYLTAVRDFVTLLRGTYADADVIASGQNPELTAGGRSQAYVDAHALRLAALRGDAYRQGWGYIPVYEAFHALDGGGEAWVNADGIHPRYDATGVHDGNQVWAALVGDYFDAMRVNL